MNPYTTTLKEVTDMFESCGCRTEVTAPSSQEALLTVEGPTSFCPSSILEEHLEKAKELMRSAHPEVTFRIEIKETT